MYGPAGVLPFMGFNAASVPAFGTRQSTVALAAMAQTPTPPASRALAIRPSNGLSRLRAGRLVAVGDRHLRSAVHDTSKLAAALDAYRRAATMAPDLPDTFLRQAIVLTALDRDGDAARAIDRAVAIDGRLAPASAAASSSPRLPDDPVFGARPDGGPPGLEARSRELLARIFQTTRVATPAAAEMNPATAPGGLNWIADRWSRRHGLADETLRAASLATSGR